MKINNMIFFLEMKHNFLDVELWVNMSKQQTRHTEWRIGGLEDRAKGMFKAVGQIGRGIHKRWSSEQWAANQGTWL